MVSWFFISGIFYSQQLFHYLSANSNHKMFIKRDWQSFPIQKSTTPSLFLEFKTVEWTP